MREGINLSERSKDRILNGALLVSVLLLIVSFTYSPTASSTEPPNTPNYDLSKLNQVASYNLPSYEEIDPLQSDGSRTPAKVSSVKTIQIVGQGVIKTVDSKRNPLNVLEVPPDSNLLPIEAPVLDDQPANILGPVSDTTADLLPSIP